MSNKTQIFIAVLIILLAAASRLIDHPWNFTPIAAMAIFAGCYLNKKWGVLLPLAAMLVSDYFIGFYDWQVMALVYASIAFAFLIGWYLKSRKNVATVIGASLSSSIVFFIVTNFAVWAFFDWYPHTWQGLITNYTLALPFFRNTLLGDLIYSGVLFGAYELMLVWATKKTVVKELA